VKIKQTSRPTVGKY